MVAQSVKNTASPAKPRLILHAGTPKTGTSTLQVFCDKYRRELLQNGVLYPIAGIPLQANPPKHQWIVQNLLLNEENLFRTNMDQVLAELANHPHVHTVVLSTEGIYNHWWDYSDAAKLLFKRLDKYFDVMVWIVFREPKSFAWSYYCQGVKNPKFPLVSCYCTSEPLEVVMDDPTFSRIFRYRDFIDSFESLFGRPLVLVTKYEGVDIIEQARQIWGFDKNLIRTVERENRALSEISLEMARRINRRPIDPTDRQRCIDMIREIDKFLGPEDRLALITDTVRRRIDGLTKQDREYLQGRYHIAWD